MPIRSRVSLALALFAFAVCPTSLSGAQDKPADALRQRIDGAIASVKPALVRVHVVQYSLYGGREVKYETTGSGVIISPEGHVITNHHVAGNVKRIFCTLADKRELEAEQVGTDPLSDIAVIRLLGEPGETFPTATFGDSSRLKVGDRVLAMGSPLALSQSVTMGIVSNTEMVMPKFFSFYKFTIEGEDVGTLVRWIAHDAEIHGGNSGGPLVDLSGKIVGINEIKFGLSGAIPGNLAREVADALIRHGKVTRSWMGLEVQPRLKGSPVDRGVLVSSTVPDSPAETAGFEPGDVLLSIGDQPVDVEYEEQLPLFNQLCMGLPIGEKVNVVVWRDGKEKKLSVKPIERENFLPKGKELTEWGITARNLSLIASKELRRDSKDGVLIISVRSGGPAGEAKPPLRSRDVLIQANDTPIKRLENLVAFTKELLPNGEEDENVPVKVLYERADKQYLTVVEVGLEHWRDPGLEVRKAWLPVAYQVLTRDMAEALGLKGESGVRITKVYPDSTAEKAGLGVGDLILKLDGERILSSRPEEMEVFSAMVRQYKIGSEAELTVVRQGQEKKIAVELAPSPKLPREMKEYKDEAFDLSARDIAFFDRMREQWTPEQQGALIQSVGEGGWAGLAQLAVNDLVLTVDDTPVTDVDSLEAIMRKVRKDKRPQITLKVKRGIHTAFIEIEPRWEEQESTEE